VSHVSVPGLSVSVKQIELAMLRYPTEPSAVLEVPDGCVRTGLRRRHEVLGQAGHLSLPSSSIKLILLHPTFQLILGIPSHNPSNAPTSDNTWA
jgi:hypothetical protein